MNDSERSLNKVIERAVESENNRMRQWGEFLRGAYEIQKRHDVQLFFFAAPFL